MTDYERDLAAALAHSAERLAGMLIDPMREFKSDDEIEQWSRILLNISRSIEAVRG